MTAPREAKGVGISQDDRTDMYRRAGALHVLGLQNRATRGWHQALHLVRTGCGGWWREEKRGIALLFDQIFRRAGSLLDLR